MDNLDKGIWGLTALFLVVIDYSIYLKSIYNGKTKPHVYSWALWACVNILAAVAQFQKQANYGAWATLASGICGLVIVAVALKSIQTQKITKSDSLCFLLAALAIPVWVVSNNPLFTVIIAGAISLFASWPTFRKSLINPFDESLVAWSFSALWPILSLFAVEQYNAVTLIYLITQIVANGAIFLALAVQRQRFNSLRLA